MLARPPSQVQPPNLGLGHSLLFTEEVDGERRVWDTEQGEEGDTEGPGLVQRSIEMEKQHCSRPVRFTSPLFLF